VDWLAALPSEAVYGIITLLAGLENVVPVVPADTAVALGAFLSHRGVTTPLSVFLLTWTANCAGAVAVYLATYRYGRAFTEGRVGRRLLTPGAVVAIEREYARFGIAGIFATRFLPGVRAVVPAFAGLVRLHPARTIVPICLASALWYGAITILAAKVGAEWATISRWLGGFNRGLGPVTVVGIGFAVALLVRRRRARRRILWQKLKAALEHEASDPHEQRDAPLRAAAALVMELAYADHDLGEDERRLVEAHLIDRWDLDRRYSEAPSELQSQADRLMANYSREDRLDLLHRMWRAAMQDDGTAGAHEAVLLGRAATLLGIEPDEASRVARASWPASRTGRAHP